MNLPVLSGGLAGFGYFLYNLESHGMGNVLFRTNSEGIKEFSFDSLLNMITAPFRYIYFWTESDLYPINWVITTLIGGVICYIIFL